MSHYCHSLQTNSFHFRHIINEEISFAILCRNSCILERALHFLKGNSHSGEVFEISSNSLRSMIGARAANTSRVVWFGGVAIKDGGGEDWKE